MIGNTSLIELRNLGEGSETRILAKTEFQNPSGSIKDRMVLYIINAAEERGVLREKGTIVEASSGNTGVSLAMIAALKGYQAVIIVPDSTSKVKVNMMKRYGAEIIFTSAGKGFKETVAESHRVAKEREAFLLDQFRNPDNVKAHNLTGMEILRQAKDLDAFVAGIGTGGTLTGIAEVLKEKNAETLIVAVEPQRAPAFYNLFYEADLPIGAGIPHKIEGIGEAFVPEIMLENMELVDEVMLVKDEDALRTMNDLAVKEGLCTGISSGANVYSAMKLAKKKGDMAKIVTVLPDDGQRYL